MFPRPITLHKNRERQSTREVVCQFHYSCKHSIATTTFINYVLGLILVSEARYHVKFLVDFIISSRQISV
jgi:hypothetical protein